MRFLRIDCGPLKQTLVGHCEQWVARFTGLLSQLAAQELKALHDHFKQRWVVGILLPEILTDIIEQQCNSIE
jgi:dynein heavy chain